MELLNNIWSALTTPNETLMSILSIPFTIIEITLSMFLFTSILNIKSNPKRKLLYVLLISSISIIGNYFIPAPFYLVINYICMLICIHLLFKTDILKTILAFIIPIIIFALLGMFLTKPYLYIFKISSSDLLNIPIYRIVYLLSQYIIAIIIYLIFKHKEIALNIFNNIDIDRKNKSIIYANLCFGIFMLLTQSIITVYYIDNFPLIITFLSFITMFVYFSISI